MVIEGQFGQFCGSVTRSSGASACLSNPSPSTRLMWSQAFHDFGKGRHPAVLNFCDCLAYAPAFRGEDFKKIDIVSAL